MVRSVAWRTLGGLAVAGLLGGCGFRPVYAPASSGLGGPAAMEMAAVEVGIIPNREGQIVRQDIQERLERFGVQAVKRYNLAVVYAISVEGIGIQPDTSATFVRVIARATWTLNATDPKPAVLTTGAAHEVSGYNAIDQQVFAGDLESESVRRKLAEAIADDISLQLGIYFGKQAPTINPT